MARKSKPEALRKRARVFTTFVRMFLRTLAKFRIVNVQKDNARIVPKKGAVIIAANHISMLDPVYLWGGLRRQVTAVTWIGLWRNRLVGSAFKVLGFIGVDRESRESGSEATRRSNEMLAEGGGLLIYPEGRITRDGKLGHFKHGATRMAFDNNCPIAAVAISGADKVLPIGSKRIRLRQRVTVTYLGLLEPKDFDSPEDMTYELRRMIGEASGQELAA